MERTIAKFLLIFLMLILVTMSPCLAQELMSDSTLVIPKNEVKTKAKKDDIPKSPKGAMIRSVLIPGWGQWYNNKKLKALVVFGAETGVLINSIYLNQLKQKSTTDWEREYYINNRNLSNWWLVGIVLFSIADSFVDAHLSDFDESPDLSMMNIQPLCDKSGPGVLVSLNFEF